MKFGRMAAARGLIGFAIVWLIAMYGIDVLRGAGYWLIGWLVALATLVLTYWARGRAFRHAKTNVWFHVWFYVPTTLLIGLPIAYGVYKYFNRPDERDWWSYASAALPFVVQLVVPVGALLSAYWLLPREKPAVEGEKGGN